MTEGLESRVLLGVRTGMRNACDDTLRFSGVPQQLIDCEYLLTVNVAKSVAESLEIREGCPYRIRLEEKTRRFSSSSVPLFGRERATNFMGYRTFLRKPKNTTRNGRIDLVVYSDDPFPSALCAVEMKAFNPPRSLVLADLERNLQYLRFQDQSGKSRVEFVTFAALHNFPTTYSEEGCLLDCRTLYSVYEDMLSDLGDTSDVISDVRTFTVRSEFVEVASDDEGDYLELDSHHFAGVTVTFRARG